jgi:hypothetical protein
MVAYVALDPIMSLAIALAEAPGSCACLLGAGVSVDADVPTGWGIFQDGLRRLYQQESETNTAPTEEELTAWLVGRGYDILGYSSLLDLITPDPAVRRQMLAGYFDGVDPGPAHELLAELAATGVIKVFITTNFDRLLEQALRARGIEPVVVSDDATLKAAPKREHSDVFIVKAHGDYMQETIRNTPSELAELDPELAAELQRIADNYGVLVIGWSGRDAALAEILRKRNSRYGMWWLSITDLPEDETQALIETTGSRTIVRAGAAEFLAELKRRLDAHAQYQTGDDPGTVHDEMLALVKHGDAVAVDEMLRRERYAFESTIEAVIATHVQDGSEAAVKDGWSKVGPATDRRIASLVPLALHRPELFGREIGGMVTWASSARPQNGLVAWLESWRFPFWIIGMTTGSLAVRLERFAPLHAIVAASWTDPNGYNTPFLYVPGELGQKVANIYGPGAGPGGWVFPEWQWLITELPKKEWLASRYPEWLRRDREPRTSFVEFALLLNIGLGILHERPLVGWWTIDQSTAKQFAQRLHRDARLRLEVAEGLGFDLSTFDEKGPEALENSHALQGGFMTDVKETANALKTGAAW